jgi:O-methyltransferase involved in polyketide biosynthesis
VMYLTEPALRATLQTLFELSAPGSTLIVNYHEPAVGRGPLAYNAGLTRWLGEPQRGLRTRESMIEEIERAGFRPLHDLRIDALARVARLLVADKPAAAA